MSKPRHALLATAGITLAALTLAAGPATRAHAQDDTGTPVTIVTADPSEQGDGTMGAAAAAARSRGALRLPADDALKAAADQAYKAAERSMRPASGADLNAAGQSAFKNPTIVGGLNFAGQSGGTASTNVSPPDNEGAIGPTRYIQTINEAVKIYNRSNGATIGSGTLNQLANNASSVNSFDPQIIWDPTTNRFYYMMDSIFSSTDNRLAFGFSKTASPSNVTSDWCHYYILYHTPFPDYPKLGDSRYFIIAGVNVFNPGFVGSDIVAVSKPGSGTTCPAASSFKTGKKANIKDTGNSQTFTPVPSNQIDSIPTGYVVARNGGLPSTKLWFYSITRNSTSGAPVFGNARGVTVSSYTAPANATQPTFTQLLDTLDARNTQAIQARNPARAGTVYSFWTQHTIANGAVSGVRWYEINPVPAVPVILRSGTVVATNTFLFNGAISPDRKVKGASVAFGQNFVIQYNVSGKITAFNPRIVAGSSINGAAMTFLLVKNGVGPYRDFTCQSSGSTCRWGDYAAATPDPSPTAAGTGEVWGTNQFSGLTNPPAGGANWRTQIFALKP